MPDPEPAYALSIIIVILCLIVSHYLSYVQFAISSSNVNRMREMADEGSGRARKVLKAMENQTQYNPVIHGAVLLLTLFSAILLYKTLEEHLLADYFAQAHPALRWVYLILLTVIFAFFQIVFVELLPKRVGIEEPERSAIFGISFLNFFYHITRPFVAITSGITVGILKLLGKYKENIEEKISEEEIKSYIKVGQEQGVINEAGELMMVNIMRFDDRLAYEIMTPRTSIFMIDYDEFDITSIEEMLATGHSRAPVFQDNTDNIVGTIYIKDLFTEFAKQDYERVDIDNVLKKPYFVPETKNIDTLLQELQQSKNYMAILIDEYGGFSGIVTMEDIVEEIVGEIEDEYDDEIPPIQSLGDGKYIVDGYMDLLDINDELGIELVSENHETISGLTIELLGFIPNEGEQLNYSIFYSPAVELQVLDVEDKRIKQVLIQRKDDARELSEERE